jgi:hypothetical protein
MDSEEFDEAWNGEKGVRASLNRIKKETPTDKGGSNSASTEINSQSADS